VTAAPKVKPVSAKAPKAPKVNAPKAPHVSGSPKAAKAPKAAKPVPPGQAKRGGDGTMPAVGKGNGKSRVGTDGAVLPPGVPKNPKLQAKLQALLPAGMTLEQAAEGFKNQGQFIAAVRVSDNLGIPFADLKTSMVTDGLTLGQSIQTLRPAVDGDTEASRAARWANQQIDATEPTDPN
jgi:hypothetical protein